MTLVDTSVWVTHFRAGSPRLISLLQKGLVLTHPYVVGELACGILKNQTEILTLLQTLPEVRIPELHEVLLLIKSQQLLGRGLGWVDISLITSAKLTGCTLWTADAALRKAAIALGIQA